MLEAEVRILASALTDLEPKRVMLSIAAAYKRLAVRAELRESRLLIDNASFVPEALKAIAKHLMRGGWRLPTTKATLQPIERLRG